MNLHYEKINFSGVSRTHKAALVEFSGSLMKQQRYVRCRTDLLLEENVKDFVHNPCIIDGPIVIEGNDQLGLILRKSDTTIVVVMSLYRDKMTVIAPTVISDEFDNVAPSKIVLQLINNDWLPGAKITRIKVE